MYLSGNFNEESSDSGDFSGEDSEDEQCLYEFDESKSDIQSTKNEEDDNDSDTISGKDGTV